MCIHLTPVLYCITTVLREVYLLCLTESDCLRDIGKPTSRAEISSPSSLYFKAVNGAHLGSALTGATSELTNSYRKFTVLITIHVTRAFIKVQPEF